MRRPALWLRSDQFEYVQLILLAVIVGVLAALGNLGFRKLIEFFSWLFRAVQWSAFGIERGGWHRVFIPVILMSGAMGLPITLPRPVTNRTTCAPEEMRSMMPSVSLGLV